MSIADINSKIAAAVAAQEAGNYAEALKYLRSARLLLIGTADAAGPSGESLRWDRQAIDQAIADLERVQSQPSTPAEARKVRRTSVTYVRPDADAE